jgi:hypothetical protein
VNARPFGAAYTTRYRFAADDLVPKTRLNAFRPDSRRARRNVKFSLFVATVLSK